MPRDPAKTCHAIDPRSASEARQSALTGYRAIEFTERLFSENPAHPLRHRGLAESTGGIIADPSPARTRVSSEIRSVGSPRWRRSVRRRAWLIGAISCKRLWVLRTLSAGSDSFLSAHNSRLHARRCERARRTRPVGTFTPVVTPVMDSRSVPPSAVGWRNSALRSGAHVPMVEIVNLWNRLVPRSC